MAILDALRSASPWQLAAGSLALLVLFQVGVRLKTDYDVRKTGYVRAPIVAGNPLTGVYLFGAMLWEV